MFNNLKNLENLSALDADATILGTVDDDILYGTDGNDYIDGIEGDDTIYGEEGNDILSVNKSGVSDLYGGNGDDTLIANWVSDDDFSPSDYIFGVDFYGGSGSDHFIINNTVIFGNIGTSSYRIWDFNPDEDIYNGPTSSMIVYTDDGYDMMDTFADSHPGKVVSVHYSEDYRLNTMENVSDQGDLIYGVSANETIKGLGGDDTIFGGAGNDYIEGNAGRDSIRGGDGDDTIFVDFARNSEMVGGKGGYASGGAGRDSVIGGANDDGLGGGADNDTVRGHEGDDYLSGDGGDDVLYGGDGNDLIDAGDDFELYLDGWKGTYYYKSSDGDDTLYGGDGDDTLRIETSEGATGTLYGGKGSDVFQIADISNASEAVTIGDFNPDEDKINVLDVGGESELDKYDKVDTDKGYKLVDNSGDEAKTVLEVNYSKEYLDDNDDDDSAWDDIGEIMLYLLGFSLLMTGVIGMAI